MKRYIVNVKNELNDKTFTEESGCSTMELVIRGLMYWWNTGTVFTIKDESGNVEVYKKVDTDRCGCCDLVRL